MSITVIQGEAKRRSFATYDFEWWPGGERALEIRICGLYDGMRYRSFLTIEDFLNALLTREYCNVWLYAHAGGLADFCFLLGYFLRSPRFAVQARFSGSAAVHVEVRSKANPKEVWIFVDSFFLLRTSLRNIMAAMGLEKGGAEESVEQFYAPLPELRAYNENDCTGLYAAINQFQAEILALNGELMPTIASTAMRLFRRAYLQRDIQTSRAENLILREAYIASRVEVFKKQGSDLCQYDINSSFPASMTLPCPGELQRITLQLPESGDCFFADVTVRIPDMDIPPLPYRRAGKVFFPTGEWRQWYSGVDVRLAEEKGQIVKVHECHHYDQRLDLREYVLDIYERRKNSTSDFQREIYKILLNSLYGKFGEQTEKTKLLLHPEDFDSYLRPDVRTGVIPGERVNGMDGAVLVTEDREIAHEHLPFAVHITAHSRKKITEILWMAGDAYYADTDCAVTQNRNIPVSAELGDLKLESDILNGFFFAPKFYLVEERKANKKSGEIEVKWKVKSKGFSRLTPDMFAFLVQNPDTNVGELGVPKRDGVSPCTLVATVSKDSKGRPTYKRLDEPLPAVAIERMARAREMLARARTGNADDVQPMTMQIIKSLRFGKGKRRFAADGASSVPYSIEELLSEFPNANDEVDEDWGD